MTNISAYLLFPSFYSLVITGIILIVVFILFVKNFKQIWNLEIYRLISLLCVIAIALGNHGILHALFETKTKPNLDFTTLF
jgi:uncharacterized membrane protein HdeD (DUF308 family)